MTETETETETKTESETLPADASEGEVAASPVAAAEPREQRDEDFAGFAASEATALDLDVGQDSGSQSTMHLGIEESEMTEPASAGARGPAEPEPKPKAPAVEIPAPAPVKGHARKLDPLALAAMICFVLVGGLLVFGFAQALVPAAEAQLGAACRPLTPAPLEGPAPEIELEDLDGNPVALSDYAGKFLVVNFWATWCDPCTREWPDLDRLAARVSGRDDVVVLAISVDEKIEDITPFLERMGLGETPVTVLRAKDPAAHQRFGSEKIPDTYFVDRQGQLESVFINVREWGRAKAVRCVEARADRS